MTLPIFKQNGFSIFPKILRVYLFEKDRIIYCVIEKEIVPNTQNREAYYDLWLYTLLSMYWSHSTDISCSTNNELFHDRWTAFLKNEDPFFEKKWTHMITGGSSLRMHLYALALRVAASVLQTFSRYMQRWICNRDNFHWLRLMVVRCFFRFVNSTLKPHLLKNSTSNCNK